MGTKERRQRERAEREQLFIAKARELVCEDGLLQLQMARLADACDYATGTLYQHFSSKEDLLVALLAALTEQRIALFRTATAWDATPRDRMFAFSVADTVFVERNPEHFQIAQYALTEVVWSSASLERRNDYLEKMRPAGELVLAIVRDAVARNDLVLGDLQLEEAAVGVWALVTGTHTLVHAEGLLEFFAVGQPYRLMGRNIHLLLNGLGWQPLFDVNDHGACDAYWRRIMDEVFARA